MFFISSSGASAFNQNIGSWNTEKVINMYAMFYEATAFNGDISKWDTGKVTTMYLCFFRFFVQPRHWDGWAVRERCFFSSSFSFDTDRQLVHASFPFFFGTFSFAIFICIYYTRNF